MVGYLDGSNLITQEIKNTCIQLIAEAEATGSLSMRQIWHTCAGLKNEEVTRRECDQPLEAECGLCWQSAGK